jgi:predicted  nucleic acid-binding Zn-ribbon protein
MPNRQKEIENARKLSSKLREEIKEFEKKRKDLEAKLFEGAPNVSDLIKKYDDWKKEDQALEANIILAKQVQSLNDKRINELSETRAWTLLPKLHRTPVAPFWS